MYVALLGGSRGHLKSAIGHFDGAKWSWEERMSGVHIRGSAADDLWVVLNTPTHFDGKRWVETPLPADPTGAYDLYARSKSEAYLVGKGGLAMKWDGTSWREINSGTREDLFCVIGGASGSVWAGGARGKMLRFPK